MQDFMKLSELLIFYQSVGFIRFVVFQKLIEYGFEQIFHDVFCYKVFTKHFEHPIDAVHNEEKQEGY
jgi:hypothetical protein